MPKKLSGKTQFLVFLISLLADRLIFKKAKMNNHNLRRTLIGLIIFALLCFAVSSQASLILSFDSSPDSWVGKGQSFTVTPEDGYIFTVNEKVSRDNSQHIRIVSLNSPFGPDWNARSGDIYHYWTLDLAAPNGEMLDVGLFEEAARWPFQDDALAGLTFSVRIESDIRQDS